MGKRDPTQDFSMSEAPPARRARRARGGRASGRLRGYEDSESGSKRSAPDTAPSAVPARDRRRAVTNRSTPSAHARVDGLKRATASSSSYGAPSKRSPRPAGWARGRSRRPTAQEREGAPGDAGPPRLRATRAPH